MSPCQRTLKKMRADGWLCAITEHWNPWSKTRNDLFGFIDVLCIKGDQMLAVQTTSASNMAARETKIRASQAASVWLESPTRLIVIHGWSQKGPRGERKTWQCREIVLTAELLDTKAD